MPAFTSSRSIRVFGELNADLRAVCNEAIKHIDFSLIDGHRTTAQQQQKFAQGVSKLDGITKRSKHQGVDGVSWAFDFIPAPFTNWNDHVLFASYAHYFRGIAIAKGIELTWGGDWNRNFRWHDQTFHDYPHIELTGRMP